ncbi:MAG: 3-deoxy-manno-octulosonate cytidylyltransferase [Planctomycetota bacterium]
MAIVPARLASTRLPRKMLLRETGRYLFEHTYRNLEASELFASVWLATDSEEIRAAAESSGVRALMTRADHESGTDRVFEAWQRIATDAPAAGVRVIVNVQGDEPDVAREDLAALIRAFADAAVEIATLATPVASETDALAANVVKVVCDARGDALYFSRAPIPSRGHARAELAGSAISTVHRRHVGVYAFAPAALERFCSLPRGALEAHENLEQLRWLEAGGKIRVVSARHVPRGIDTRQDYESFVARTQRDGSGPAERKRAAEGR